MRWEELKLWGKCWGIECCWLDMKEVCLWCTLISSTNKWEGVRNSSQTSLACSCSKAEVAGFRDERKASLVPYKCGSLSGFIPHADGRNLVFHHHMSSFPPLSLQEMEGVGSTFVSSVLQGMMEEEGGRLTLALQHNDCDAMLKILEEVGWRLEATARAKEPLRDERYPPYPPYLSIAVPTVAPQPDQGTQGCSGNVHEDACAPNRGVYDIYEGF